MPGQPEIFTNSSLSSLGKGLYRLENSLTRAYKLEQNLLLKQPIGKKYYYNSNQIYTYKEYYPYDDNALRLAINASYSQIYGNFHSMESERPIDLERRLRNGDITIKEFIRGLIKSKFYLKEYFEKVNQKRCIELLFKHILGRPLNDEEELRVNVELICAVGFEELADSLIDSPEYQEIFGENIVPYTRFWDSPTGSRTSSFINTALSQKGSATSDNVIYGSSLS